MAKSEKFSRTISYKGELDVSNIIKSLEEIRSRIDKESKQKVSTFAIGDEIRRVNNLYATIKEMREKGIVKPQDFTNYEKEVDKLFSNLSKISLKLQDLNTKNLENDLDKANTALKEQERLLKKTKDEQKEQIKNFLSQHKVSQETRETYAKQIVDAKSLKEVQSKILAGLDAEVARKQQAYDLAKKELSERRKQILPLNNYRTTSFKNTTTGENITTQQLEQVKLAYADSFFDAQGKQVKDATIAYKNFTEALKKMNIEIKNGKNFAPKMADQFKTVKATISGAKQDLDNLKASLSAAKGSLTKAQDKRATREQILNSPEILNAFNLVNQQQQKVERENNNVNQTSQQIKGILTLLNREQNSLRNIDNLINTQRESTTLLNRETSDLVNKQRDLDNSFSYLKRYAEYTLSLANGFRLLRRVITSTFNDIQTLDKAFAQVAMVTDLTIKDMWNRYDRYAEIANRLGQTTISVIQASGLYVQQGLEIDETFKLTEETMKLATLAGLDFKEATSQMTSALRGFKLEMDEGQRVTDVYSELAAKAAADVQGIAYAMSKTSSIAYSAGMSFENTAAFLTQMIKVI